MTAHAQAQCWKGSSCHKNLICHAAIIYATVATEHAGYVLYRALIIVCTNACTHTHNIMHTHTPLDNQSNVAAIVGGVVGGLVVLGIISLIFGIIIVAIKLRKRGTSLIIIIAK